MLERAERASHIDPPASSYAIMQRASPYCGENPEPGKDVHGELELRPGIREQPGSAASDRYIRDAPALSAMPSIATNRCVATKRRDVPKPAVSRCSNMPCAEGRVIPAAGTSDYCGSLCSGRRLLRRPYGLIPFYLLFERVVFAKPVSTFAGDAP